MRLLLKENCAEVDEEKLLALLHVRLPAAHARFPLSESVTLPLVLPIE